MAETEMWQRCLWALRLEVEPSIAEDVEKHVTEKITALRTERDTLRATVAGLQEVLAFISMIADSIWVDCVTGAADASDPAPMKAESIMKAVKDALAATSAPDGRRDAGEGGG